MPTDKNTKAPLKNPFDMEPESVDKDVDKEMSQPAPVGASPKMDSVVKNQRNRVRPLLEGINTPAAGFKPANDTATTGTGTLTEAESKLISETNDFKTPEPKLTPKFGLQEAMPKRSGMKGWIIAIILIIILGVGGYEGYTWYENKEKTPVDVTHTDVPVVNNDPVVTPVASTTPASTVDSILPNASSTPASSTPVVILKLKINSTPTGFLNVRSTPSTSAKVVTQVHPGETYTYITSKTGWYEIMLPDNSLGWVSGQYVTTIK